MLFARVAAGFYRIDKGFEPVLDTCLALHEVMHETRAVPRQAKEVVHNQNLRISTGASTDTYHRNVQFSTYISCK